MIRILKYLFCCFSFFSLKVSNFVEKNFSGPWLWNGATRLKCADVSFLPSDSNQVLDDLYIACCCTLHAVQCTQHALMFFGKRTPLPQKKCVDVFERTNTLGIISNYARQHVCKGESIRILLGFSCAQLQRLGCSRQSNMHTNLPRVLSYNAWAVVDRATCTPTSVVCAVTTPGL